MKVEAEAEGNQGGREREVVKGEHNSEVGEGRRMRRERRREGDK